MLNWAKHHVVKINRSKSGQSISKAIIAISGVKIKQVSNIWLPETRFTTKAKNVLKMSSLASNSLLSMSSSAKSNKKPYTNSALRCLSIRGKAWAYVSKVIRKTQLLLRSISMQKKVKSEVRVEANSLSLIQIIVVLLTLALLDRMASQLRTTSAISLSWQVWMMSS